jgi:hypothetical protein
MKFERKIQSITAAASEKKQTLFAFCDDGSIWKTDNPISEDCKWEVVDTLPVNTTKVQRPKK